MFKLAYSYGLRCNELRHLQTVDFSGNAHAREFGRYGVVQVRYGKAKKGSPPKRRGVLTVFRWTPGHRSAWRAKHRITEPRHGHAGAPCCRTARLQLQHRRTPRRNRSPTMGPLRDQNSPRTELTRDLTHSVLHRFWPISGHTGFR